MAEQTLPSAMGTAALMYARRGWPVFPCRERPETVTIGGAGGKTRTLTAKAPYTGNGLKDATTDEARIVAWWRQHPGAAIGVPTGVNGCFVIDFDPRVEDIVDPDTGEITGTREWTLDQLKADLEAQMGVALPPSLTSRTPSGGVHVWYRQPVDGDPIRNRGNLPEHVDVRGLGGYVIGPPSRLYDGDGGAAGEYRWIERRGDWRDDAAVADAPAELVAILRAPKVRAAPQTSADRPARRAPDPDPDLDEAVRKYALSALDGECKAIRDAPSGRRNPQLNESAFKVATLVAAGALDAGVARASIEAAARANPGRDDAAQLAATIESGWTAGLDSPRDLAEVASASRSRRGPARSRGHPSAAAPRAGPAGGAGDKDASFRTGMVERLATLVPAERARVASVVEAWLQRRLARVEPTRDAVLRLAFSIGLRIGVGLIDRHAAAERLMAHHELLDDVTAADVDRALDDGAARDFDVGALLTGLACAQLPMTDFGIGERFHLRHGADFRFTTTQGWLGWDTRRWRVLDQDKDTPPAEVIAAVFDTVRAIQDEARLIEDTGVRVVSEDGELDLDQPHPHGLDRLILKSKQLVKRSALMRAWGRDCETAGRPASIAALSRRWLTAPIAAFDHDPYAVNVLNGTLRFRRETLPDGSIGAAVELSAHRREDMLTKLAPVEYDPAATSPLYDGLLAWAQPDAPMRRYLHQVGGYALTGDAGEQKLWFWYGRGRNGKGVTIESWCYVAGDYSGTVPIASFLDQGVKKRGDAASPDLAKLPGVRMLRTSEPGRNEKLDSALIKLVTGGEPIPVRNLHRGFFDLVPTFKLIISGNTRFDIPDTDDGIWGRLKLVSWLRNIDKPEPGVPWPVKDLHLAEKIKRQEASGVLNHLVRGLLDYLAHGLIEPKSVTAATAAYRDQSDPLARFLRLCVTEKAGSRVQSSKLHEVFAAWCKAAGEREWSNKGFSNALTEKGFRKKASDGMQWLDIELVKTVIDFVDADGRVRVLDGEHEQRLPTGGFAPPDGDDDDDMPP